MLITIYNNNESDRFETDFKSNLILPKNCELKLTNAYISLSHKITIPDLLITISANGTASYTDDIPIAGGTYALGELANLIETEAQTIANENLMSLDINFTYDSTKGYGAGCFILDVEATSKFANIFQPLDLSEAEFNDFDIAVDDQLVGDATKTLVMNLGVSYVGVSEILDKSAPPVSVESWGYFISNETLFFKYWLRKGTGGGTSITPPITKDGAGCFTFQDNGNAENYYVGLTNKTTDFSDVNDDSFTEITNLDNIPVYVLIVKTTNGTYLAGEAHFFEIATGGTPVEVGKITATRHPNLFPISADDSIGVVCNAGGNANYYVKKSGLSWSSVGVNHGALRHTFDDTVSLHMCMALYTANSGTNFTDTSIKNPSGTIIDTTMNNATDAYGQFIEWDWGVSGVGSTDTNLLFGFTDKVYNDDTSAGDSLANILEDNTEDVKVDGTDIVNTWKLAPYINLLCESLPINSYSDTDTDTGQNGLDNSKCIASIPRYDLNGNFNVGYNLTYDPVEANVIKLNNAEEINVSQLRFRLQQSDGQIPKDLASPMGFVLDFNGQV
tara:strand:+ start:2115 stop:3791 length:1677 start_codon:yes stop_codon:yes gene_type:complete